VPFRHGVGIERDPALVRLARDNARANGWSHLHVVAADVTALPLAAIFDHAFANPPYHDPAGTRSDDAARERAKRAPDGVMEAWSAALAPRLRPRGTLTFILPAALLPACLTAMTRHGCGSIAVLPLWPRPETAAKLLIVQAIKGGRAPLRLLAGLALHRPDGRFTDTAEAILRHAHGLPLG
jgi:tRNA1(Val) A37 N6-methylase TrmN6